jgi:DNA invertase Pin-like site-specific DNA recombinase
MKCAVYARVSTVDKGQDPEMQLKPMRDYCERMGLMWDEYVDFASGAKENRPGLDKLMVKIRNREYDLLIVWRLSRLTRSLSQLINIVYNELRPRNISFKCIMQDIDTSTATGRLALNIMGAFDEFEHDIISENVSEGIANTKRKGNRFGRKRVEVNIPRLKDAYEKTHGIRPAVRIYNEGLPDNEKLNPGTASAHLSYLGVLKKVEKTHA